MRAISKDYKYLRTDADICKVLDASRAEEPIVFPLYATAIFTGMRAGELAGLKWEDIDFEKRLITVQRSYKGPCKADDVRYVPILARLLSTLREWRLQNPCDYVFPTRLGTMMQPSSRVFQEIFQRVLEKAGIQTRSSARRGDRLVFHGLRHTFASHWVMNGGDMFRLQKILGHKGNAMTQRYAHLSPTAFEGDFDRFGKAETLGTVLKLPGA